MSSRARGGATAANITRRPIVWIVDLVEASETPVYVVSAEGVIVHANTSARARGASAATWVPPYARDIPTHAPASARKLTLTPGGVRVTLVFSDGEERDGKPDWSKVGLSSALHPIATMLAQGMRDKAIAEHLHRPVATVRSYVTRIYRVLGVTRRVDVVLIGQSLPRVP